MITELEAKQHLAALKFFPVNESEDQVYYFAGHVEDHAHAERAIAKLAEGDEWPDSHSFMRVIAETRHVAEPQQIAQWQAAHAGEVRRHGKCPQCGNWGNFTGPDGLLRRCTCKYATPQWVGNVFWNSDEWLERFNRALSKKPDGKRLTRIFSSMGRLDRI